MQADNMVASREVREVVNARTLIQVAGLVFYLLAVQAMITAGVGVFAYFSAGGTRTDLLLLATAMLQAACYVVVGHSLRRYRLWARNFGFVFAVISLFALPVGTVLGTLILVSIDRANRAGVFPRQRRAPAPTTPEEAPEEAPLLVFEPELAAERAG
jgi:hypothetical protein